MEKPQLAIAVAPANPSLEQEKKAWELQVTQFMDPVQFLLASGDLRARIFLHYRDLEEMMQLQQGRDFSIWDRQLEVSHVTLVPNTHTQPRPEQLAQWKRVLIGLSTTFEDERAINELVSRSAQQIRRQGRTHILPTEYLLMFTTTRARLRRYNLIEQFLGLQPFELENEVSFYLPEQGVVAHHMEDPLRIISFDINRYVAPFLGQVHECLDETGQHLNWSTLMWITEDSGASRRAEEVTPGADGGEQLTTAPPLYLPPCTTHFIAIRNGAEVLGHLMPTPTPSLIIDQS